MGFVRLLFIVILTCLIIDKVEAPKGRQKARGSQQPKLAVENSVASDGITSENLESHYVRLFFDQMEDEAHKSLEQRIGEFLLSKQMSKASNSSSGASSKAIGKAKNAANADCELLAKLHLTELIAILVGKTMAQLKKSELAKRFGKALDEEVREAKAKMRRLVGRRMFLELEIQEPFLLRINLVEQSEYLIYYKEILSAPVANILENSSACRLYIPLIFGHLLDGEKRATGGMTSEANVKAEVERRRKKVLGAIKKKNIGQGVTETELIPRLAHVIYEQFASLLKEDGLLQGDGGYMYLLDLNSGIKEEHRAILRTVIQHDPERQLQNFIRRTRGARARFCIGNFVEDEDYKDFLGWTESDFTNRLMQEYILVLTAKSDAERLKAKMSVDILVQVHFLDKQLEANEANNPEWLELRDLNMTAVDKMVDADEGYVKDFGTLYKHFLYKVRNQKQPNEGELYDFRASFAELNEYVSQWEEFSKAGKKRPPYLLADPQEVAAQAEWLDKKHQEMVEWLKEEHAELRKEFEASSSTSQGQVRIRSLFNSHLRHKNVREKGEKRSYYNCPKNTGKNYYEPVAEYHPYVEYLFGQKHMKYQIGLNALKSAYAEIITDLLSVYPAKNVEELRVDWTRESKNLAENEQRMIKQKMEPEKVKAYTVCKAHAFLLHRLVNLDLGSDIDDEDGNQWKLNLRETHVSTTLIGLLAEDPNYGNFDANCEPEVAKEVADKMITKEMPMQWPHFHYLKTLIYKYEGFRRIICHHTNRLAAKSLMKELMGDKFFGDIELLHPEILQIENMLPSTRLYFYDLYLENFRNHPKISKLNELRIAIPLLLGRVRDIEAQFRGNALVESHIEWLLEEMYPDLERMVNARSICLLSRFIIWNESNKLGEKKSKKGKLVTTQCTPEMPTRVVMRMAVYKRRAR